MLHKAKGKQRIQKLLIKLYLILLKAESTQWSTFLMLINKHKRLTQTISSLDQEWWWESPGIQKTSNISFCQLNGERKMYLCAIIPTVTD